MPLDSSGGGTSNISRSAAWSARTRCISLARTACAQSSTSFRMAAASAGLSLRFILIVSDGNALAARLANRWHDGVAWRCAAQRAQRCAFMMLRGQQNTRNARQGCNEGSASLQILAWIEFGPNVSAALNYPLIRRTAAALHQESCCRSPGLRRRSLIERRPELRAAAETLS